MKPNDKRPRSLRRHTEDDEIDFNITRDDAPETLEINVLDTPADGIPIIRKTEMMLDAAHLEQAISQYKHDFFDPIMVSGEVSKIERILKDIRNDKLAHTSVDDLLFLLNVPHNASLHSKEQDADILEPTIAFVEKYHKEILDTLKTTENDRDYTKAVRRMSEPPFVQALPAGGPKVIKGDSTSGWADRETDFVKFCREMIVDFDNRFPAYARQLEPLKEAYRDMTVQKDGTEYQVLHTRSIDFRAASTGFAKGAKPAAAPVVYEDGTSPPPKELPQRGQWQAPSRILREAIHRPTVIMDALGMGQHQYLHPGDTLVEVFAQDHLPSHVKAIGIPKAEFDASWQLTDAAGKALPESAGRNRC